jgi:hypothetical protein
MFVFILNNADLNMAMAKMLQIYLAISVKWTLKTEIAESKSISHF